MTTIERYSKFYKYMLPLKSDITSGASSKKLFTAILKSKELMFSHYTTTADDKTNHRVTSCGGMLSCTEFLSQVVSVSLSLHCSVNVFGALRLHGGIQVGHGGQDICAVSFSFLRRWLQRLF